MKHTDPQPLMTYSQWCTIFKYRLKKYIRRKLYNGLQWLQGGIPATGTDIDCILEGINKYLLLLAKEQIRLAFEQSEKEVQDLRQRTKEGMQTARLSGKQIGQASGSKLVTKKSIAAKEIILKHNKTFGGSLNDLETITQAGITRKTFYKYKKELLSEMIEQTNQR